MSTHRPLNLRDPADLQMIPSQHHAAHEFCFCLHDVMVALLKAADERKPTTFSVNFKDNAEANAFAEAGDPISGLVATGRMEEARRFTQMHVSLALYADLLHYVFEALRALEKRKFAVAFTLLRKPLRENLLFLSWVCADESDFFERMLRSPADHMEAKDLPPARRLELFAGCASRFPLSVIDAEHLHLVLFDRNYPAGLATLFDKATHLVTSRSPSLRTEELNFNFIFKPSTDNDVYAIYPDLAYALLHLALVQIDLFSRWETITPTYRHSVLLTALGSYEALFTSGRSRIVGLINSLFGSLMKCPHCGASLRLHKRAAARFFFTENLGCAECGQEHHFPLFWLSEQAEWREFDPLAAGPMGAS